MTGASPPRKRGRLPALDSDAAMQLRPRFGDLSDWERAIVAAFPDSLLTERIEVIREAQRVQLASRYPAVPPQPDAKKKEPQP